MGCAGSEDAEPCRDGFELASDDHCYPPPTPWPEPDIHDALDTLPPCESESPDGAIDIANGCADGACVGMAAPEISAILDTEPDCTVASWNDAKQYCLWPMGIEGLFDDEDEDGMPDDEAPTERIHLVPPYAGQTEEGSGVAVNVSCYLDDLGYPDVIVYHDVGGTLMVQDLIYDRYGLKAYDWGDDNDTNRPDGRIDNLYLYGEP
jgi:hypothetical protein